MNIIVFYIYLLLLLYNPGVLISVSAAAIISVPPVDTVGCYGGEAIFYCGSERDDINQFSWTINGAELTDKIMELRGITVNQTSYDLASLTIAGLDINDGIAIGCVVSVAKGPPFVDVKGNAKFTVFNIPPVENLTISFTNNGVMNIIWSKPLSCTPANYSYIVSINTDVPVLVPSTILQYSVLDVASCMDYTVSVTVTDTQYQSIPVIQTAHSGYYEEISKFEPEDSVRVFFNSTKPSERFASIPFNCSDLNNIQHGCGLPRIDLLEKIKILTKDFIHATITIDELLTSCNDASTDIGYHMAGPFHDSFRGTYSLHLETAAKQMENEVLNTEISTYNVQKANIEMLFNAETMMECVFASNSSADGCSMELISMNGINRTSVMVPKPVEQYSNEYTATLTTVINDIPEGYYNVNVYDIVEGLTITTSPAYTITSYYHSVSHSENTPTTSSNGPSDAAEVPISFVVTCVLSAIVILFSVCVFLMTVSYVCLRKRRNKKNMVSVNPELAQIKTSTASNYHISDNLPLSTVLVLSCHEQSVPLVEIQHDSNDANLDQVASYAAPPQQKPSFSKQENASPLSPFNNPPLNPPIPTKTDLDLSHESHSAIETRNKPIPRFPEVQTIRDSSLNPSSTLAPDEAQHNKELKKNEDNVNEDNYTASPLEEYSLQGIDDQEMVATKQSTSISQDNEMEERAFSEMENSTVCVIQTFDVPICGATMNEGIISDCTDFEDSPAQLDSTCVAIQATPEGATETKSENQAVQAKQTHFNWGKKIKDVVAKILKCWQYCG